jgi:hypothetical protein
MARVSPPADPCLPGQRDTGGTDGRTAAGGVVPWYEGLADAERGGRVRDRPVIRQMLVASMGRR